MTETLSQNSLMKYARIAGIAYLLIFVCGFFAEFFVRSRLIVDGDAAATITNMLANAGLFRAAFSADVLMVVCDVIVGVNLFVLLRAVHAELAMYAMIFRLLHAVTLAVNLLNHFFAVTLAHRGNLWAETMGTERAAMAQMFWEGHGQGYLIGLVFFGISCILLGTLMRRTERFPAVLGILIAISGIGYLYETFSIFLFPETKNIAEAVVVFTALAGELPLCLWLLIKGVRSGK